MALINIGEDTWLRELEQCKRLQMNIMAELSDRKPLTGNGIILIKQFTNEVQQLQTKLEACSLTDAEYERRQRQLELLQSKVMHMQQIFNQQGDTKTFQLRQELFSSNSTTPKLTHSTSVEQLRAERTEMIRQQEHGLQNLSETIARQKEIATKISTEVDLHNDILDNIGTTMTRTDDRLRDETQYIGVVQIKEKTCIYWTIIIVLFIAIVTVAVI